MIRFLVVALTLGWAGSALAQEDGPMASLHDQRREGGRICMSDHFHNGSSGVQPSRKQAEAAAVHDWAGFTAWEYGAHWGQWSLSGSRSIKCQQSGGGWTCEAEARPCKPLRRR
jgi:hypothetical protein